MTGRHSAFIRFVRELRRRRVFRTAGLYIVGAWLVMQAADVFFPAWGLPDAALNVLLLAATLGLPLALVFGWFYDITAHGIVRTPPRSRDEDMGPVPLQKIDYLVLVVLGGISVVILYQAGTRIADTPVGETSAFLATEIAEPEPLPKLPNSVAVLPLDNLSNDPANEIFCDGISEEILHRLGGFGELHVIGRASSFSLKGANHSVPKMSDLLGARYLLRGSVRRQGDRIRVSAQLLDEGGAQRWSETFDRNLGDVFAIQSEIADMVASQVAPQITLQSVSSYKPDVVAWQHYLAGRDLVRKRDVVGAREQLEKAIEIDPAFADSYAEAAIARLVRYPDRADLEAADRLIKTALALQPSLARALAARGLWLTQQVGSDIDYTTAIDLYREALANDSTMVDAMNWLSGALTHQGKYEEAEELMLGAYDMDPLNAAVAVNVAAIYTERGHLKKAEDLMLRLAGLPEPPRFALMGLGNLYLEAGRLVDMNTIAKRLALTGLQPYYRLALNYAVLGLFDTAEYWAARADRDFPDYFWSGFFGGTIAHYKGNYEEAAHAYELALDARNIDPATSRAVFARQLGLAEALAGRCDRAIAILEPVFPELVEDCTDPSHADALQALAWCFKTLGRNKESEQILLDIESAMKELEERTGYLVSSRRFVLARNAVLLEDKRQALERLEHAIRLGWRGYYVEKHDPRWDRLRDDPLYRELMAKVKADVDRQRAEVERMDAEENFPDMLDTVRASRTAMADDTGMRP